MKTRQEVVEALAVASNIGRLGLFVGTGFSIAVTNGKALSFLNLIKGLAREFGLDEQLSADRYKNKSLPQIATELVAEMMEKGLEYAAAVKMLKTKIAELCFLVPDTGIRQQYVDGLKSASPSWIVTTNYDLILESLIEEAEPLLSHDILFPNTKRVPVYHLHGHRHHVESICVTEEDYVEFLGPIDYKRLRLPLLFLESTTLLLGYSLGDINVRSAMSWAKSLSSGSGRINHGGRVIQALYRETPKPDPYLGRDGETIIEINDTAQFLAEVGSLRPQRAQERKEFDEKIETFLSNPNFAKELESPGNVRDVFLYIIEKADKSAPISVVIKFLRDATDPIWKKARADGGFHYYDVYLSVLIDVLKRIKHRQTNPNLVAFLGDALDQVGSYYDEGYSWGSAHEATKTWLREVKFLDKELLLELKAYAKAYTKSGLSKLLSSNALIW